MEVLRGPAMRMCNGWGNPLENPGSLVMCLMAGSVAVCVLLEELPPNSSQ